MTVGRIMRPGGRARDVACALVVVFGLLLPLAAAAEPVNGQVSVATDGGYARIIIKLDDEVGAKVDMSGAVLIVNFAKPVAVPVDRVSSAAPEYLSAARLDPDGSSIRIALAKKVTVHTIRAAERLYVDLLPETWSGLAPGLPQDVIDELAKRARDAEQQLRKFSGAPRPTPNVRVKVGVQPTFVRYIFDVGNIHATSKNAPGKLTLTFDQTIKFDLADAKATLPGTLDGVNSALEGERTTVVFRLKGKPLVRSFREDRNIVVDIGGKASAKPDGDAKAEQEPKVDFKPVTESPLAAAAKLPGPAIAAPDTVLAAEASVPSRDDTQHLPAKVSETPAGPPPAVTPSPASKAEPVAQAPVVVETKPLTREASVETKPAASSPPPPAPAPPKMAAAPPPPTKRAPDAPPVAKSDPASSPLPPDKSDPAAAPKPASQEAAPARPPADPNAAVTVVAHRQGGNLRLDFPFAAPTPAAVFRRGRNLWVVFDSAAKIDTSALAGDKTIRRVAVEQHGDSETVMRLALEQPKLASFFAEGPGWVLVIGDTVVEPTKPVTVARSIVGKGRSSITIPFAEPRQLHKLSDPEAGDTLFVVTALGPARGFIRGQDFVELRTLPSTHGVVVQPLADDIDAELAADKITVSRPGGLSLSSSSLSRRDNNDSGAFQPMIFDTQTWGFDRQAKFDERQTELIGRAAMAPEDKRRAARLNLARFYLARDMAAEAKGVLDVVTADEREADGTTASVLKAVANVMLNRPEEALKELSGPQIGGNSDAPIWRAMAHAAQGQWPAAREEFKTVEAAVGALPIELQRLAKHEALRASIEVRDFAGASTLLNDFETLGLTPDMVAPLEVLTGRLEEGLGHYAEALNAYRAASASRDRRYASQGELRELVLRSKTGELKRADLIAKLETLTTAWRGDATEIEGLQILGHLYTQEKRYRDAFHVMRTALLAHPNSDLTRKLQDEAAASFDTVFMSGEGDSMPAVEALGLFYDYRELTPIGRRGDEMIRRLCDRLVAVDLLDQASELLQHQVDHRLQGAARAQVASRLATIYLMNRKPDRALAAIRNSRVSDLAGDVRDHRLLLESRALSDIGRYDVALELIENMKGPETQRLRADILWAGKRWRPAAEALELLDGERWKDAAPLADQERSDVLRAAIGYAMAEEPLSLSRLREKYAAKMSDGPDRHAFEVVTAPIGTASSEFRAVAGAVANMNTLNAFLADMRKRFPDKPEAAAGPQASAPQTQPAQDAKVMPDKAPAGTPQKPDKTPTGSIAPRRGQQAR